MIYHVVNIHIKYTGQWKTCNGGVVEVTGFR